MSDKQDTKLDAMLHTRRLEAVSPDLAQRIILKAQSLPQNRTVSPWQWIRQLFAELHLPKPAYVVASALVLGIVVGASTPDATVSRDEEYQHMPLQVERQRARFQPSHVEQIFNEPHELLRFAHERAQHFLLPSVQLSQQFLA
jgi:hypothetical protein